MTDRSRRGFLRAAGAVGVAGSLAGCGIDTSDAAETTSAGDVAVGPRGRPVFEPASHTVSVGDTVAWKFASASHNVSAVPEHSSEVSLPDGADPFASYGVDGNRGKTEPKGATYEHTFEVPGTHVYVCVPHVRVGMVGEIVVEGG